MELVSEACSTAMALYSTSPHLAIRAELEFKELMPVFAGMAHIIPQIELVCHGLLVGPANRHSCI